MIRNLLRKLGIVKFTLIIVGSTTLSSVLLYLITGILIDRIRFIGIVLSTILPAIVTPFFAYFIVRLLLKLDVAERELIKAKTELEVRIKQRTAELVRANKALQAEIAERIRAEETIRQMAYHDVLTGLPNRMLFNDRCMLALAHADRNKQRLALMVLDLDQFKDINDTLGHSVGDQLLQAVSNRLAKLLRKTDTIARMGGDEFLLLLPKIVQTHHTFMIAQKILEAIRKPFVLASHELKITTSIGIAIYPDDGEDIDTLMKNADIALYHAKGQGRDNCQRYVPSMNVKS